MTSECLIVSLKPFPSRDLNFASEHSIPEVNPGNDLYRRQRRRKMRAATCELCNNPTYSAWPRLLPRSERWAARELHARPLRTPRPISFCALIGRVLSYGRLRRDSSVTGCRGPVLRLLVCALCTYSIDNKTPAFS